MEDNGLDAVLAPAALEEVGVEHSNEVYIVLAVSVVGPIAADETVDGALGSLGYESATKFIRFHVESRR